jgi:Spy/CpxP family protein refolding chaperone
MRAANGALAMAIVQEHRYGPAARQAIESFHAAMAMLQEATVQHVLAMREVLTPEQAEQFDQTIAKALNSDQK